MKKFRALTGSLGSPTRVLGQRKFFFDKPSRRNLQQKGISFDRISFLFDGNHGETSRIITLRRLGKAARHGISDFFWPMIYCLAIQLDVIW